MTNPTPEQQRADEVATGIEQYAAFVRANPEHADRVAGDRFLIYLSGNDADPKEQMATLIRRGLKAGARIEKNVSDKFASVSLWFGVTEVHVYSPRDLVCERVVTGTHEEIVEEPDPDALAAVPKVTKTVVVEDVKWVCSPLLAATEQEGLVSA